MAEKTRLYTGLNEAMWGFILLGLDIKLGSVSILPAFAGWLLLASSSELLSEERRDLGLLKPLCRLMALWTLGDWLLSWTGRSISGHVLFLDLLATMARLYFCFQFLTDLAALAQAHRGEGQEELSSKFLRWRTVQTVLITMIGLWESLSLLVGGGISQRLEWTMTLLAIAYCFVSLAVVWNVLCLRDWFKEPGGAPPADQWTEQAGKRLQEEK